MNSADLASMAKPSREQDHSCVVDQALAFFSGVQDPSQERNYSLDRFINEPTELNPSTYISEEATIQAHMSTMKTCLDDFDTRFFQH